MEFNLSEILSGEITIDVQDGDIFRVREIGKALNKFVTIEGSVYFSGRYSLLDRPTLKSLLQKAELRPQAKTDKIFIERLQNDNSVRVIPVALDDLLASDEDIELEERDRVLVFNQERYRNVATLTVSGMVKIPFQRPLSFDERITLDEAIELAGGLQPVAAEFGYVFRRDLFNSEFIEYIPVNLLQDADFKLKPGDQLRVYNQSNYTDRGELSVGGAVNEPQTLGFDESLSVKDLLLIANGLERGASPEKVEVYRLNITMENGISFSVITLEVDDSLNVINAPENFNLQPFDRIVVRRIPEFFINANVDINGEVKYPGNYPLENRSIRLSDVISVAGGLTRSADPSNAILLRNAGNVGPIAVNLNKALNNKGNDAHDPVIFDGDLITIPRYDNSINIRLNATRIGELTSQNLVDTTGTIATNETINVVFKGKRSAKWYIENHVGGFATEADKWSVTVTKPNGEVQGTKRRFLLFKDYPTVTAGSTIALHNEIPEPERDEPIIDWDEVQSRSIQATTSFLTILILLERLGIQ
jgi:protein involved in polysaccharide export with SLBB domain